MSGHSPKTEKSRLNLFYILQVLSCDTDEEHPMTTGEIAKKINAEFAHLATEEVISRDTVKRILEDLTLYIFPPESLNRDELTRRYGYYIHTAMKTTDGFCPYRAKEGKQPPKKYYYMERDLQKAEIFALKDAIETYSYFSEEDIASIVEKLVRLRPLSFSSLNYYDAAREERTEDSLLLLNIDDLSGIIQRGNFAEIIYCAYGTDKKLHPRPGYPQVVEPLHLMWSNGYYYLLAYHEKYKDIVNFRIDRITSVTEVTEQEREHHKKEFNPVLYRHEHPVMYGGPKEPIELLCRDTGKNYMMNTIMDVFGKNAHVNAAEDALVRKYFKKGVKEFAGQGITWWKVGVEAAPGGVELWALQHCIDCFVIKPQNLAERVKERLSQGSSYYL